MFYLALEKIASGYRDHIISVSNVDRQSALDNKLIDAKKITIVYNGLPQVPFLSKDEAKKELGLERVSPPLPLGEGRGEGSQSKFIVGSTSNFYRTKGLDILIDAVALMDEETKSKIQVAVIGEGPERKNLELRIKNFGLGNCVTLAGNISGVNKYLKAFDIFVLPSRKEGFPFAILEAMQAGLPIIATNVGGIPESLGNAGILIAPENPKALAGAMQSLLTDLPKQKELAQKAQERSKLFTEEKMLAETKKVYELVMEK
jgi:glycosyltransferase involved in cell wall biosynthesis